MPRTACVVCALGAILAAAAIWAQTDTPDPRGDALLLSAMAALEQRDSIAADAIAEVNFFGQRLHGKGSYRELRQGDAPRRFRFELVLAAADRPDEISTFSQVCDGRQRREYRKTPRREEKEAIELARIVEVLGTPQAAAADVAGCWLDLGGLPTTLRALNEAFTFDPPETGELDGQACWKLVGRWRPERLAALLTAAGPVAAETLPDQLPDEAVVYLRPQTLFPSLLEYYRRQPRPKALYSGRKLEPGLVFSLRLHGERFDDPMSAEDFQHGPTETVDRTAEYLKAHGVQ